MRRYAFYLSIAGVLCLAINARAFAQGTRADSSSQQNALNNTLTLYYSSLGKQSPLYNGPEYYFYDPIIKGNAYYDNLNAFTPGSINYDNMQFKGVPMLYDIYSDQVVILLYNRFTKLTLIKDKVSSFDFLGQHFIRVDTVAFLNNPVIKPGYYQELYNGHVQVLARRTKDMQNTPSTETVEQYFNAENAYFIKKNNLYYGFSGQRELLGILKDKKKQLQKYIKDNHIKYRRNPEEAMVKIASYYDHLTD
jgi:hypothetical protein